MVFKVPHHYEIMVDILFIRDLAMKAGKMIETGFSKSIPYDKKESYADLVTEVDKAVESYICQEILASFPSHKIIAEEGYSGNAELTCSPTWIIDPIDGTSNFVSRFPFVCVSIAYYVNKEPEVAVVYNPILKWMFHAIRNQGAFLNDKQICTSSLQDLSQALVLTDWGGDRNPSVLDIKSSNIRQIISKVRGVRTMGSAALHMCQIAAGNGDIFFEFGIHCWDYAAAVLIVREAGGYCCNFDGKPVDLMARNVICAGTPELANALISLIQPVGYARD
ncbi:Inositol monophosphatase 2 isoform 1 [Schistosoma japonicum]|uniref:Inositol-1-monophosphatase n=2 Tax=Schistosoma japonicum TaxID=6182 RepID=C1LK26_SCHJA|nr:Inositol monophosphatase 2 [Schistosoma japonicum]TNN05239.1 Inositol monophosphatase 2 isoform 1 [Schistosoma japonicum]CAX75054.1 inositol(myo)-1(or 4)-monophosphatase 2 [Schistosoma japonicum]